MRTTQRVFVPYRGFYFLNMKCDECPENQDFVFVPYRGFYFLNCFERLWKQYPNKRFSSPIGAFIFLITKKDFLNLPCWQFSSPIGAFIFLIGVKVMRRFNAMFKFSSPIGAFIFLILALQSLYLCGLKRCFAV